MPETPHTRYQIEVLDSITSLDASDWDALVEDESPFLSHAFLSLLEETGCTGERAGWYPLILVARKEGDETRALQGALPLYVKTNSEGEFIFDWAWADAAYRAGIAYYPKGVVAVPFSPVSARKLLVHPELDATEQSNLAKGLIAASLQVANQQNLSSLHYNFLKADELEHFEEFPTSLRYTMQYHWYNGHEKEASTAPYASFDEFLSRFRSKRRANIRRERKRLKGAGVTTRVLQGDAITEEVMARMFRFYVNTVNKFFYGRQYLKEDFFLALPERLGDHLHLVFATHDGEDFAGAFNLYKGDRLYGRYWGCTRDIEFAHFEVCMYTPIEWCIEHGVKLFEPGAGGEHKYERGFEPTTMYSMHYLADPRLAHGVEMFLEQERSARAAQIEELHALNPFKDT